MAWATAETVQRTCHRRTVTVYVPDATLDLIHLAILAAGNPIPLSCMGNAEHHDLGIGLQHYAAAGGLVAQTNEISYSH